MSRSTIAKDRVGFVSGSVLGWGILLATLRPWASHLYTGATLRFNLDVGDMYAGQKINPEPIGFLMLNALVALGVCIVILAIGHLIAHGLFLASGTTPGDRSRLLGDFADATFLGAFRATLYVGIYFLLLLPVYPAILLQHWLVDEWSIGRDLSSALVSTSVLIPTVLMVLRYVRATKSFEKLRGNEIIRTAALICVIYVCYVCVAETAYTLELSSRQSLYSKVGNPYIEALIKLGGATSAAADATVEVRDQSGLLVVSPPILPLDRGLFHTYFPTESLPPGEYQLELRYARPSLTNSFPYWRRALTHSVFVSLVP